MKSGLRTILVVCVLICCPGLNEAMAQKVNALGSYSPYSLFGAGRIEPQGTSYNLSMGGIGIALRDNRFINYINPAAITARDTLAFMLDFGVVQKNSYNRDNAVSSAYNVFNMQNVVMTFPIYRKSAMVIGIVPYSNVGYKFQSTETDPGLVSEIGDIKYQQYGTGSIYKLFAGASMVVAKRISIGAEAIYYFGNINRHSDILFNSSTAYNTVYTGWNYKVHCFSGKFGIQYTQPFRKNDSELTVGATYHIGNRLKGDMLRYAYTASDTVMYDNRPEASLYVAEEFGVGVSYRVADKWTVGVDFVQQNWSKYPFVNYGTAASFSQSAARYYRAGFEITPNRDDLRYYMKRVTYRVGGYFEESYVMLNGHRVNDFGITFGASFPIFRGHNAISVAVNLGQRGTLKYGLVRERYFNFVINFNLHDVWFVKYRYE